MGKEWRTTEWINHAYLLKSLDRFKHEQQMYLRLLQSAGQCLVSSQGLLVIKYSNGLQNLGQKHKTRFPKVNSKDMQVQFCVHRLRPAFPWQTAKKCDCVKGF